MRPHPLASLIPSSNRFDLAALRAIPDRLTNAVEAIYDSQQFHGCFVEDAGEWQKRIADYDLAEFLHDTPQRHHLFSEVFDSLGADEGDGCHVYSQCAFDAYGRDRKGSEEPYSIRQDSGICVDSSNTEMKWGLIGYLVEKVLEAGVRVFAMPYGPSHYAYAERGSCGQGWTMSACATVNSRIDICPAMMIEVGGNRLDFDGENKHESKVTRDWCRSGVPSWLQTWTNATFPWGDGAITRFDGSLDALRRLVANGGQFHHGGNATAANSRPDSWKRIGGHAQTMFGGDWSERTVRFFADKGLRLTAANDFWVVNHQTWGGGWGGETSAEYWPAWWGTKPQGAWVSRASSVLSRLSGYAYLPRLTWFKNENPQPPPPPPAGETTPLVGSLVADNGSPIRGVLTAGTGKTATEYIIVPKADGTYQPVRKVL